MYNNFFFICCHIVAQYNVKLFLFLFLFFWFFVINVFLFQYPLFKVLCLFTSSKMKLHSSMLSHSSSFREGGWNGGQLSGTVGFSSSTPNMSPGLEFRGEDCLGCASQPSVSPWGPSVCSHRPHSASIYEMLAAWDVLWVLCGKNTHNMKFTILII